MAAGAGAGPRTFVGDLEFGLAGERSIRNQISSFLNADVELQGGFSILDIHTHSHRGEIKSRRENSQYFQRMGSIIIGKNKIDAFADSPHECWCFFNLSDGLFGIKYDPEVFSNFVVQNDFIRHRRSDYNDRPHAVVHIPFNMLTRIT